jgi:uncharacterized protein YebE (UPF0316 family)
VTIFKEIFSPNVYTLVVLPLFIFVARILDVSIGTIRIIFVSRGKKFLAPILGFFEVLIWIIVIGQVMQNLGSVFSYIAYAGGFATGTLVGMIIEEKLAIGVVVVRIIIMKDQCQIQKRLSEAGFGVTTVDAYGKTGEVKIIYSIMKRKELEDAIDIIESCDSKVFYSIEDAKKVNLGVFRTKEAIPYNKRNKFGIARFHRRSGIK